MKLLPVYLVLLIAVGCGSEPAPPAATHTPTVVPEVRAGFPEEQARQWFEEEVRLACQDQPDETIEHGLDILNRATAQAFTGSWKFNWKVTSATISAKVSSNGKITGGLLDHLRENVCLR